MRPPSSYLLGILVVGCLSGSVALTACGDHEAASAPPTSSASATPVDSLSTSTDDAAVSDAGVCIPAAAAAPSAPWPPASTGIVALPPPSAGYLAASPRGIAENNEFLSEDAGTIAQRLDDYKQWGIGALYYGLPWSTATQSDGGTDFVISSTRLPYANAAAAAGLDLRLSQSCQEGVPASFASEYPDAFLVDDTGLTYKNMLSFWWPYQHVLLEHCDPALFQSLQREPAFAATKVLYVPIGNDGLEPIYPSSTGLDSGTSTAPAHFWFYDAYAQADFREKMRARYCDIAHANRVWGTSFREFPGTAATPLPQPGQFAGPLWEDLLVWYRQTKYDFMDWQYSHLQRMVRAFWPTGPQPRLVMTLAGSHVDASTWNLAVASAGTLPAGAVKNVAVMTDYEGVIQLAHKYDAELEIDNLEKDSEILYANYYLASQGYSVPVYGQNVGQSSAGKAPQAGPPDPALFPGYAREVVLGGLVGFDFVNSSVLWQGSSLTEETDLVNALTTSYETMDQVWSPEPVAPELTFTTAYTVYAGECLYNGPARTESLCVLPSGAVVVTHDGHQVWTSGTTSTSCTPMTCELLFEPAGENDTTGGVLELRDDGGATIWTSGLPGRGAVKLTVALDTAPYLTLQDSSGATVWPR